MTEKSLLDVPVEQLVKIFLHLDHQDILNLRDGNIYIGLGRVSFEGKHIIVAKLYTFLCMTLNKY